MCLIIYENVAADHDYIHHVIFNHFMFILGFIIVQ